MKIALYSHSILPAVDGVARRFAQIIDEFVAQGHEVILFTLEEKPQQLPPTVKHYTLKSCCIPNYSGKLLGVPTLVNLYYICSALHVERPDVIHCVGDALSSSFGLLGKSMGIPVVTSIHTDIQTLGKKCKVPRFGRNMSNFKEQVDSRILDGCATTSLSFSNQLLKQGIRCDHVIKTSVDVTIFHPDKRDQSIRSKYTFGNSDKFLAVFVGRLAAEKRLEICLKLVETLEDLYVAFIGDGPLAPKLAQYHGAENRVYCEPGFLTHEEIAQIYASADIHLSASLFETLGNTVLEAHACGTAVVVPKTQGFLDTVSHGEDGYLYDSSNSNDETAFLDASQFIQKLMDDREHCRAMGSKGREKVLMNTKDVVVKDLISWYKRSTMRFKGRSQLATSLQCVQLVFLVILSIFFCHLCEKIFPFLLVSKNKYLSIKRCVFRKIEDWNGVTRTESKFCLCDEVD